MSDCCTPKPRPHLTSEQKLMLTVYVLVILFGPFLLTLSVNTLFDAGMDYNFKTWLAWNFIFFLVGWTTT